MYQDMKILLITLLCIMPLLSLFIFQIGNRKFQGLYLYFYSITSNHIPKSVYVKASAHSKTLNRENKLNFWNKRYENVSHAVECKPLRSHGL